MTADLITAELFDTDGVTSLGAINNIRGVSWQDELSKVGNASFEVPLADATAITDRRIVKFSWRGAVRFGCQIRSEQTQHAVDGTVWVRFENQPGLLALLDDAGVQPEYGFQPDAPADRLFGYMSKSGPWYVSSDWVTPDHALGPGSLAGYPTDLRAVDSTAEWIALNLSANYPIGEFDLFRGTFTTTTDNQPVKIFASADNYLTLYLDGEEVVSPPTVGTYSYADSTSFTVFLSAGTHTIAAKATNGPFPNSTAPSRVAFICSVVDWTGNTAGSVIFHTQATGWQVTASHSVKPGWLRAQVLKKAVEEAQALSCVGPSALTIGFTDTADTASVAWTGNRDELSFPISFTSLTDLATGLAESGMDVGVDASNLHLNAWNRRGSDLTATVELKLGAAGGTLKSYETTRAIARKTVAIVQSADGRWSEVTDSAGLAAYGRIEGGLSIAAAKSQATASTIGAAYLEGTANPNVTATAEVSIFEGKQLFADFNLGDTIKVPGYRSGTMKARVVRVTVDGTGETVRTLIDLREDRSV